MKTFLRRRFRRPPAAFALIIVLGCLVFLSALAVAFLTNVTTELRTSKSYASGSHARSLAETAVNFVIAQIGTATGADNLAWASQPGMIRTYDNGGNPAGAYKLYSSPSLVIKGKVDAAAEASTLANWSMQPAHFTDLNAPAGGTFPIVNPAANTEGFGIDESLLPIGVSQEQMPVAWLYVLANGEIVPADVPGSATATAIISGASASNPIVGRIAFWTDDECAKVNINTAAEGKFWDTPRVTTQFDKALANYQPTKNEFQRYPGHPAMTSLRTALPFITTNQQAYDIAPRVKPGGSQDGTVSFRNAAAIEPDKDRLYASLDEVFFTPDRNSQIQQKSVLEQSRFFLTASSRAPEVNMANRPRIAMWPIHSQAGGAHRSVADQLIAFCATIDGKPYYFQRGNAASGTADYESIARNRQLMEYLDTLTAQNVAGFGGNFAAKYGADRPQILTEIFDYIRCTNLNDQTVSTPYAPSGQVTPIKIPAMGTKGFGRFPMVHEACLMFYCVGENTGSTPYPVAAAQFNTQGSPAYSSSAGLGLVPPPATKAVQAILLLSFFDPAQGWTAYNPDFTVQVERLNAFEATQFNGGSPASLPMGFPAAGSSYVKTPSVLYKHTPWGGVVDFRNWIAEKEFGAATGPKRFPFHSKIMEIKPGAGNSFSFKMAPITIKIYAGDTTDPAALVQTVTIPFPSNSQGGLLPNYTTDNNYRLVGATGDQRSGALKDRFDTICADNQPSYAFFFHSSVSDTVKSMVSKTGDMRLHVLETLPFGSDYFVQHGNWSSKAGYSLRSSGGDFFAVSTAGRFVKNLAYDQWPLVPNNGSINGVNVDGNPALPAGDWDNGIAGAPDGPYINKPDEGNVSDYVLGAYDTPYYGISGLASFKPTTSTFFTPNRQIPSSGMLGSLPTGVKAKKPWRTLLFRPDPAGTHPGSGSAPDHLFMDLFWMPVVEPYPISEPFSTAGKINMNCQIMPFIYIRRETGVRAVLKSERILAVPSTVTPVKYKSNYGNFPPDYRKDLDLDETMKGFQARFAGGDIFRSASEIATLPLVPVGTTYAVMSAPSSSFWAEHGLTGDNSRERPYANIYPRLTTKSNTFTVHYRVQALQKRRSDPAQNTWVEGRDAIVGEYRGSTIVERYIDPNNSEIPDYATDAGAPALDTHYKFRILSSKQFNL